MLLIGISAKAGCGKTTFANILCKDYEFTKISFGDAVKEECAAFTGLPLENFNIIELKEAQVTCRFGRVIPRKFMQIWGTEFRRAADNNYWLQALWTKMLTLHAMGVKRFVVDDVRFKNEADFIRQCGGVLVRLQPYEGYKNPAGNHISETDLDDYQSFDFIFSPAYGKIPEAVDKLITGLVALIEVVG